ncbi:hypothetical protein GALMADRAFT_883431 [Galerina marginata CBS 339.88]|uniref:Uncharacterized protein n=1 Tax=Galerina marginata (strain CBS 339.88) TaxID=685588 RepID=A0A067SU95_GALM3|nr:hypothetical protein GALMADRAFT_883431 [Galerina marginata CBS 339.88]
MMDTMKYDSDKKTTRRKKSRHVSRVESIPRLRPSPAPRTTMRIHVASSSKSNHFIHWQDRLSTPPHPHPLLPQKRYPLAELIVPAVLPRPWPEGARLRTVCLGFVRPFVVRSISVCVRLPSERLSYPPSCYIRVYPVFAGRSTLTRDRTASTIPRSRQGMRHS